MTTTYVLGVLLLLAAPAFAQTDDAASATPSGSPALSKNTFESGGLVETKMFIPEVLMKGRLHAVGQQAENDGLLNTYFVSSGEDVFEVTTGIALRTRIRELYAIDKLRGMSKTDEFAKAMANAGKQKIDSVVGLVKDPVGTVKRVPGGASRFFGRIGEGLRGSKAEGEATFDCPTGCVFGDGKTNVYPIKSEYEYFHFYKWDQDMTYPCSPAPACLPAPDKANSQNNPSEKNYGT